MFKYIIFMPFVQRDLGDKAAACVLEFFRRFTKYVTVLFFYFPYKLQLILRGKKLEL